MIARGGFAIAQAEHLDNGIFAKYSLRASEASLHEDAKQLARGPELAAQRILMRDRRTLKLGCTTAGRQLGPQGSRVAPATRKPRPTGGPIVCRAPNGLCSDAGERGCRDDLLVGVDHA
jgi:hypothetical protein